MNYYNEIKAKLLKNEIYNRVKDYSKERHRVITYFEIGKLLHEAGKHYGESIIKKYSEKLSKDLGSKYNERTLRKMRQFYIVFSNLKWSPEGTELIENKLALIITSNLTWSHYRALLSLKNVDEINYYIQIAITNHLTKKELESKIKSREYQRLPLETRKKLITKIDLNIKDYVPNPIYIKNKYDKNIISEKLLHNLIMEDIAYFMKELGDGYCFIESEYKIKIDDRYNYIDFLLYNLRFRCYVVIELKVTEFKSEYIGQILKYMHYIDSKIKTIEDNNTIGIIICKRNNQFYLEYCSDERIITREYKLI